MTKFGVWKSSIGLRFHCEIRMFQYVILSWLNGVGFLNRKIYVIVTSYHKSFGAHRKIDWLREAFCFQKWTQAVQEWIPKCHLGTLFLPAQKRPSLFLDTFWGKMLSSLGWRACLALHAVGAVVLTALQIDECFDRDAWLNQGLCI